MFAVDAEHLLVLTNLEYAKDPAGVDLLAPRQNARFFGQTIARTDAWIRTRHLSRDQVRSVNFLLKSRARRYVAAGKKEWVHPEAAGPVQWRDVGVALLPPEDELFHFGGEMYFGCEDGTSGYRDAYGRTTGAHEFLQKPEVPSPGPNDRCGCGSGWKFRRCCAGARAHERPSWRLLSTRERNLGLVNAITDLLLVEERPCGRQIGVRDFLSQSFDKSPEAEEGGRDCLAPRAYHPVLAVKGRAVRVRPDGGLRP